MVIHEIIPTVLYQSGVPQTPDDWIMVQQTGCNAEIVLQPEQEGGPGVVLAPDAANRVLTLWAPIIDGPPKPTLEWMDLVSLFGLTCIDSGRRLLVRCQGGISRSSLVVCLILVRLQHLTAEKALEYLRQHNLYANPNNLFLEALRDFATLSAADWQNDCDCGGACGCR